jgi:hypothetical protein
MKQLLVFILFAGLLCWFMFAPVYKHVMIMRQAALQQETDYLLEVGSSGRYGFIDEAMIAASRQRLAERGFSSAGLVYEVTTTSGMSGTTPSMPVLRGTGIRLQITYPYQRVFAIDRLIGIEVPEPTTRMGVSGMKMSEFVP